MTPAWFTHMADHYGHDRAVALVTEYDQREGTDWVGLLGLGAS